MVAYRHSDSDALEVTVVIRPNRALSRKGLGLLIVIPVTVCLLVGWVAAAQGFWPVLPFAGLEALAVALGLRIAWRRSGSFDEVRIASTQVEVRRLRWGLWRASKDKVFEVPTAWARVRLRAAAHAWYPRRLTIGCHGRAVEIGVFLCEKEREELAAELRRLLTPWSAWRSPASGQCPQPGG